MGAISRRSASFSTSESASMVAKYGLRATLMPTFTASGLPPFSFVTTVNSGYSGL
jgi:hypothetical protein